VPLELSGIEIALLALMKFVETESAFGKRTVIPHAHSDIELLGS
jgi:hypothetical protein